MEVLHLTSVKYLVLAGSIWIDCAAPFTKLVLYEDSQVGMHEEKSHMAPEALRA